MTLKIDYSAPELIDLSLHSVKGDCTAGSTDVAQCNSGSQAQNNCISTGNTANESCQNGDHNSYPLPVGCSSGALNGG